MATLQNDYPGKTFKIKKNDFFFCTHLFTYCTNSVGLKLMNYELTFLHRVVMKNDLRKTQHKKSINYIPFPNSQFCISMISVDLHTGLHTVVYKRRVCNRLCQWWDSCLIFALGSIEINTGSQRPTIWLHWMQNTTVHAYLIKSSPLLKVT